MANGASLLEIIKGICGWFNFYINPLSILVSIAIPIYTLYKISQLEDQTDRFLSKLKLREASHLLGEVASSWEHIHNHFNNKDYKFTLMSLAKVRSSLAKARSRLPANSDFKPVDIQDLLASLNMLQITINKNRTRMKKEIETWVEGEFLRLNEAILNWQDAVDTEYFKEASHAEQ